MRTTVRLDDVVIRRPVEEVFDFVADMESSPQWGRTTLTTQDQHGPVRVGTTFYEESRMMGRVLRNRVEVTEVDRPTSFAYVGRFENGMEEQAHLTFSEAPDGTHVRGSVDASMPRVPQPLAPVVSWQLRRKIHGLFENLRSTLEPAAE